MISSRAASTMAKRVLTLTTFLVSGAGKAIVRLAREINARGTSVEVISSGSVRGLADWPEYVAEFHKLGIPHHRINLFDRENQSVWRSVEALSRIIKQGSFDLIHCHAATPAFIARAALDLSGVDIPVAATVHSWDPGRPSWMNIADICSLNRCDRVICVSESYRKWLMSCGLNARLSETIHWGLDLPDRAIRQRNPGAKFRIATLGRIEPRKDLMTLVRAFALFRRKVPQSMLFIAGPVADRAYARRLDGLVSKAGIGRSVRFAGKVRDTHRDLAETDVYVTASVDEGFGLSLLEAMSFGLPTVCTAIRGHEDFAKDGENTLTFRPGDYRCLAEAMFRCFADAGLSRKLGKEARRTARRFRWNRTAASYLKVFRSLWS